MKKENKYTLLTVIGAFLFIAAIVYFSISDELQNSGQESNATNTVQTQNGEVERKYEPEILEKKYVAVQTLNLRDKPSTQGKIKTKLHLGDEVGVLEENAGWDNSWTKVRLKDGTEGYVAAKFLKDYNVLGERVYKRLRKYCDGCFPFLWGAATAEPKLAVVVPFKFWAKLSVKEKYALCDYMYKLVEEAKYNPYDFFTPKEKQLCFLINPNALLCKMLKRGFDNLEKGDWGIILGVYRRGKVSIDEALVCGDTSEYCDGVIYPDIKELEKRYQENEKAKLFFDKKSILKKRLEYLK